MTRTRARLALAVVLVLLNVASPLPVPPVSAAHSSSTIGLLAIDSDPGGNTATSLGPLDWCARVEAGSRIDIDYVVDAIPADRPMIGFEAAIRYDPQRLEVVDVDHDLLLAAAGDYSAFAGLSDDLPDSDGNLLISVLDTASSAEPQANVETGPGVLARITFAAKTVGSSAVSIAVQTQPLVYPLIQDTQNESILADRLGSASVAVGEDCPPRAAEPQIVDLAQTNAEIIAANPQLIGAPTPSVPASPSSAPAGSEGTPAPATSASRVTSNSNGDDGSTAILITVVAVALSIAAALTGVAWYLYQRSRKASRGE